MMIARMKFPFNRSDMKALRQIELQDAEIVGRRIGPEGERQVRTASGEIFNINNLPPRLHAKHLARNGFDPHLPPANAGALRAA